MSFGSGSGCVLSRFVLTTGNCEGDGSFGVISLARSVGNGRMFESLGQKISVPGDTNRADLKVQGSRIQ
jgi:hypothetical protein